MTCPTCGVPEGHLHLTYKKCVPWRVRWRCQRQTCGLCLMPALSYTQDACDFCGVSGVEMCRVRLRQSR